MGMKPRCQDAKRPLTIGEQEVDLSSVAAEVEREFDRRMRDELTEGSDFATYEKTMLEIVHEIARKKLEEKLQSLADSVADRVMIDHTNDWHGIREGTVFQYRRHAPGTVSYHSLVGTLRVRRHTYRECHRAGSMYVPLELEAGIMERMTPALARCVAIGHAYMPPRQAEQFLLAAELRPPSRSTLDRAARDLGAYAVACHDTIEPLVRANEVLDPRTRSIALGLDRTAVPMRHGEGGGSHGGDLRRSRPKPRNRAQIRGPVKWRMDYVATFSLLDDVGKPLTTRKYRLPGYGAAWPIVESVMADVRRALEQRPQLQIAVVQDGAPELWKLMKRALNDEPLVSEWTEVLDWYHVDERLTKCLDLCTTARTRSAQRKRWHALLLESDTGMKHVIRSLRRRARTLDGEAAEELTGHANYFARHKRRTAYASCRENALPIGSGITEGACKSVVGARAKKSGQRWSQRGLSAALHLRSIHQSDRFDSFWSFFSKRYRARHIVAVGPH